MYNQSRFKRRCPRMQDPLKEIYECVYEAKATGHPMTEEEGAVWEFVRSVLGNEVADSLIYSQSRSLSEEQYDYFRAGFRLGARLMLDLR
jgi:hypothetical protein